MNKLKDGFDEICLFLKNMVHVFRLLFSLIRHNPKSIAPFIAKLIRRTNETLAVFFANYRLNREDLIKNHDYFSTELNKLYSRTNALHGILNKKPEFAGIGFSILLVVDSESESYAVEGISFFSQLTGKNYEVLISCPETSSVYSALKSELVKYSHVKLFSYPKDSHIISEYQSLSLKAQYPYVVAARIQDWPRPDLLYRLQTSLALVKSPENYLYTCAEVGFFSHSQVYDVSRFTTFRAEQLPYYFMKSSCHMICVSKNAMQKINDVGTSRSIFELALSASLSDLKLYTIPFELYHYRISKQDSDENLTKVLKTYYSKINLPLVLKSDVPSNPMYFPFVPQFASSGNIHVIVLYKDNKDITVQCAQHLIKQTYRNLSVTFVDNNSSDLSIANVLQAMNYEVVRVEEPFNYSRLNNLGIQRSKYKGESSYLFLNNDVFLEESAVEELSRWIEMPNVGIVGGLLTFEDGTIQHAGLFVDKVMNIYIPWEHQDIGLNPNSAKTGRALQEVQAVTGACLLMKKEVYEQIGGWDEIFYPISFSDTDLCRRVRRLGYKIIYTPDSKGVHLESKTRGYSLIEDYECSSWLFWTTEQKNEKNVALMGHHFLDIPELFRR